MTSRLEGEKTGICVMYTGAASEIDDGRRRRHERRARAMIIIKKTQQNAFFETTHPLLFIPLCRSSKPREFVYTITQQSASDDDDRHRRVALASNVSLIKLGWKWKRRTLISSNHNLSLFHVIKKKHPSPLILLFLGLILRYRRRAQRAALWWPRKRLLASSVECRP